MAKMIYSARTVSADPRGRGAEVLAGEVAALRSQVRTLQQEVDRLRELVELQALSVDLRQETGNSSPGAPLQGLPHGRV